MKPEWITAIATLVYAGFTLWIIIETRRDRKLLHQPSLEATLKNAKYPDWLLFNVKNVGKGPALNCKYICKDDGNMEWKLEEASLPIRGEETVELKFEVVEEYEKRLGETVQLEMYYTDIFKRSYKKVIFKENTTSIIMKYPIT